MPLTHLKGIPGQTEALLGARRAPRPRSPRSSPGMGLPASGMRQGPANGGIGGLASGPFLVTRASPDVTQEVVFSSKPNLKVY